jgi:ribonucleotide reductase beta subunit family protein with ferritin-like domain
MSVAQQSIAERITYDDLYRRWEVGNWKATELDFSQDRDGWDSLNEIQRRSALWIYSMFFYGEDAVTDGLSPYIEAAPKEEQKYFLATQQVDEARHAVFFHRFFKEVIGVEGSIADGLEFTTSQLGWGYRNVFARLERMVDELHHDCSLPKFAQAITLYHMVIEAAMAQPGQHFIEDFFAKAGTMPGFSAGMERVSRDEQRHKRQSKLLRAGVLGEPNGKPQVDPEIESILFDVVARSARTDAVDRPVTIQWRFEDAQPWHVRIDNGSTSSGPGLADDPDVTLRTTWADWVDISIRGKDARRAMLRRKLKPRGSLRQLARMPKIFPPRPAPIE